MSSGAICVGDKRTLKLWRITNYPRLLRYNISAIHSLVLKLLEGG